MATSSFTNKYSVTRKDAEKLHNILSSKKKAKAIEVKDHKEIKGHAISKFLGIAK